MTNVVQINGDQSPFDQIKQTRPDGSEFWSARDMMPLLGYGADWRNFEAAIFRAMDAADNQGGAEALFVGVTEKGAGRPRANYEMARFACYLVAMNGDPRKAEVAAAQTYFAIKTREAEVAPARELSFEEMTLKVITESQSRIAAQAEQIKQLEPKANSWTRFLSAEGDMSVGEAAQLLLRDGIEMGRNRLFKLLAALPKDGGLGWIYRDQREQWQAYQPQVENGRLHVKASTYENSRTGELFPTTTIRVTTKGFEAIHKHLRKSA